MTEHTREHQAVAGHGVCADCGCRLGDDNGPPDGWELEDGRTVCHVCCVRDFRCFVDLVADIHRNHQDASNDRA
jgi:hypothetical protein